MKLYAVCVKAKMKVGEVEYLERWCPISKLVGAPANRRGPFRYAPAVFTNKKKADKYNKTMNQNSLRDGLGLQYVIIDFDSGEVAFPEPVNG